MSRSSVPLRRRLVSAFLASVVAALGGGLLVLTTAGPAAAAVVTITSPANNSTIQATSAVVSGTADSGNRITVVVQFGPGTGCKATTNGSGNWHCTVTGLQTHEDYAFTATRTGGAAADTATNDYSVLLPPSVDGIVNGKIRGNSNEPTLTGTSEPDASIEISVDGQLCTTDASPTGVWSCPDTAPVSGGDGDYAVVYRQKPLWSGINSTDASTTYELDTTALEPTFTAPTVASSTAVAASTSDSTPKFSGTGEPGATVHVWSAPGLNQPPFQPDCTALVAASGTWTCTPVTPFALGDWSVGTYQVDDVGNTSPSPDPQVNLTVLVSPGLPLIATPTEGSSHADAAVHISGTAPGSDGGEVTVRDDGTSVCQSIVQEGSTSWTCTATFTPGSHTIVAHSVDGFGTAEVSLSRSFTVLAPPVPASTPAPSPSNSTPPTPPLDWTVQVFDPSGTNITGQPVAAGTSVVLTSSGIPTGYIATAELHSTPVVVGTSAIGPDGTFSIPATLPIDTIAGAHEFEVTLTSVDGSQPTSVRDTPVTVTAGAASAAVQTGSKKNSGSGSLATHGLRGPGKNPGLNTPLTFTSSMQTAQSINLTPVGIAATGGAALGFLFFVAVPSELLESTVRSNYPVFFGWLTPVRKRFDDWRRRIRTISVPPAVGSTIMVLLSSVILGFSSPSFGFNGASVRLFFAMFLSLAVINVGLSAIVQFVARRTLAVKSTLDAMPATILLVLASVLLSRALGIEPGFLFGVVLGLNFAVELSEKRDALISLLGIGLSMVTGLVAWLGYSALEGLHVQTPGFWFLLLEETLTAITAEALATLVIALLPLEFLDGKVLWKWSKWAWAVTYAVALLLFLVIILPMSDNWGNTSAKFFGWGAVFFVFCLIAVGLWIGFQVRRRRRSER